jgi:hypothetical protein
MANDGTAADYEARYTERLSAESPHVQRVVRAFWQAMAELDIPPHIDGQCSDAACTCAEMSYSVNLRACELLGVSP